MELSNIVHTTRAVEITHPGTGDNLGVRMMMRPIMSPDAVNEYTSIQQTVNASMDKQPVDETVSGIVACIDSWEWYGDDVTWNGEKNPKCDVNTKLAVVKKLYWIRPQLMAVINDTSGFFTK